MQWSCRWTFTPWCGAPLGQAVLSLQGKAAGQFAPPLHENTEMQNRMELRRHSRLTMQLMVQLEKVPGSCGVEPAIDALPRISHQQLHDVCQHEIAPRMCLCGSATAAFHDGCHEGSKKLKQA